MLLLKPLLLWKRGLTGVVFFIFLYMPYPALSQTRSGNLTGVVTDASNGRALYGVSVSVRETGKFAMTFADGKYYLDPDSSRPTITFRLKGYQSKEITATKIAYPLQRLDIALLPLLSSAANGDSTAERKYLTDTLVKLSLLEETRQVIYNKSFFNHTVFDQLRSPDIQSGTDKNANQLAKRLTGVIVNENGSNPNLQSFMIGGMGERYNQLLLNNMAFPSFDNTHRAYPLEVIPAEAVEEISLQVSGDPSLPGDYAGGALKITTKDFPVQNFYYLQAGGGFSDGTVGEKFLGDQRGNIQWMGFDGKVRDLPSGFPTTRSEFQLNQKNPQEQVDLTKRLNNNLAPVDHGSSFPNTSVLLGFGRTFRFRNDVKIGLTAYLNQQRSELIDESVVQSSPDPGANSFPFSNTDTPFIRSSAGDRNYRYASQMTALINGAIAFGNNKISWKNMIGNHFINSYTDRQSLYRNDDDSTARSAILYKTEERFFISTQVNGEHALGATNRFRLDWNASYLYYHQENPDDRNFSLRRAANGVDSFELGVNTGNADLSNNGRLWRQFRDHNFTGQVNISLPFTFLSQPQLVSGGVFLQNKYRVFSSDLLMVNGAGFFPVNELLAAERYYPGGLSATNYFVNKDLSGGNSTIRDMHRGNYTGSSNTGSAYISLNNKLSHKLSLDWGIRVESNSQMASSAQFQYFNTYKNPQVISLDENIRIVNFSYLPSVTVNYEAIRSLNVSGSFFQTVNRPQLQELTAYRYYDPSLYLITRGNPLLSESSIDNIRAGFNWLPTAGTTVSVSGFYKKIFRPIEYVMTSYLRGDMLRAPHNTPPATVKGIDVSFRTKLDFIGSSSFFEHVSFFANGIFLESEVEAGPLRSLETTNVREHQLSGSPEYTVNGGLTIQAPQLPHLTVLYSQTADYLYAVGSGAVIALNNGNVISTVPDYWTKGRQQMDIQLSQQFFRSKLQVIAGVNNILKKPFVIYQDLNGNGRFDDRLVLANEANKGGFYRGGTDNAVLYISSQPMYYFRISYLFR